jgi:hypothetical protein
MARSSVSKAPTLLSSSAAAAGAGAAAAVADFAKLNVASDPTANTASTATSARLVIAALQLSIHFIVLLLLATNYVVVESKKF